MMKNFIAIILAAGEGRRMKSAVAKVLYQICGKSMLEFSLELIKSLKIKPIVVLSSRQKDQIKKFLPKDIKLVYQKSQRGTADAVKCVNNSLKGFSGNVLIVYADNPLLKPQSLKNLIKTHIDSNADCTLLTAILENPAGYGRVIRDNFSNIIRIVEDRDAGIHELSVKEISTGIFCFKKQVLFSNLGRIKAENKKREYYLTDIVEILKDKNCRVESCLLEDIEEALGVNSRQGLVNANKILRFRIMNDLLEKGVTILDPENTYIHTDVVIGQDTTIFPFTFIERNVKIGKNCSIGPFCHLRSGTNLADDVEIGNFVEISRSKINKNARAKHFAYLGDALIDKKVNVGAGAVTANYDGKNKNKTWIRQGAFIGCDTVIVAPAKIGKNVVTGAGSVILKEKSVPDNSVVVGIPARVLKKKKS